jgi:hypothetical protein
LQPTRSFAQGSSLGTPYIIRRSVRSRQSGLLTYCSELQPFHLRQAAICTLNQACRPFFLADSFEPSPCLHHAGGLQFRRLGRKRHEDLPCLGPGSLPQNCRSIMKQKMKRKEPNRERDHQPIQAHLLSKHDDSCTAKRDLTVVFWPDYL